MGLLKSFVYAFRGLALMRHSQRNFKIHLLAMLISISAAFYWPLSGTERAIIIIMVALVLSAEIFNTAIEKLCDLIDTEYNPAIGQIKDIAAAAVLILALASLVVAFVIFWPYLSVYV